jgi:hypothetical protein
MALPTLGSHEKPLQRVLYASRASISAKLPCTIALGELRHFRERGHGGSTY